MRRIPLRVGNFIGLAGTLFGIFLIILAPGMRSTLLTFFSYLVAWLCLEFFPHGLAHYTIGVLVGVRFRHYTFGRSSFFKVAPRFLEGVGSKLVVLTLRVDPASLRSVSPFRRRLMFASGAAASVLLPFFAAMASFGQIPWALSAILLLISLANFAFDLFFSPKAGDISRAMAASQSQ